jgi:AcrR family transcriptional regulator
MALSTQSRLPQQARSKARFEDILEAASMLAAERGWEKVSVNVIAGKAGVNIASLYAYAGSKELLLDKIAAR